MLVGSKKGICSQSIYLAPIGWPSCIWHLKRQENKGEEGRGDTARAGPNCLARSAGRRCQRALGVVAVKVDFFEIRAKPQRAGSLIRFPALRVKRDKGKLSQPCLRLYHLRENLSFHWFHRQCLLTPPSPGKQFLFLSTTCHLPQM